MVIMPSFVVVYSTRVVFSNQDQHVGVVKTGCLELKEDVPRMVLLL